MTREEILAAIKGYAEKHGRVPSLRQFQAEMDIPHHRIEKHFGSWKDALKLCGMEPSQSGSRASVEDLFKDWTEVVRKLGRIPASGHYHLHGKYSVRPLINRFGAWSKVAAAMHAYTLREGLQDQYRDVMDIIARHHEDVMMAETESAPVRNGVWKAHLRAGQPVYGTPLGPSALACEPVSEGGVVFLFGMLAKELGFAVTRIHAEFPDCEALCRVEEGKWQKVRIEFEYASKNFVRHMHDPEGCDLIVCWVHDWPECGLEVIELRSEMKRLMVEGQHLAINS